MTKDSTMQDECIHVGIYYHIHPYTFTIIHIPYTYHNLTNTPSLPPGSLSDGDRKKVCLFAAPAGSSNVSIQFNKNMLKAWV